MSWVTHEDSLWLVTPSNETLFLWGVGTEGPELICTSIRLRELRGLMLAVPLDPPSNFVVSQSHVQGPKASSLAGAVESPTLYSLGVGSRPAA